MTMGDGSRVDIDQGTLLNPLEVALRAFAWGVVLTGLGLVASKLF
jgi:hypothetical protein